MYLYSNGGFVMPKYPEVSVKLSGRDGNAFSIIGIVSKALRESNVPEDERNLFMEEAMAGNYDDLLRVCMKWVDVT